MNSSARYRRFERRYLPKQIGVQPENIREHYKKLQQQPVDVSNSLTISMAIDDFKNQRGICIDYSDGTISIDSKTVFPETAIAITKDSPLAKEVWKGNSFHLVVPAYFSRKEVHITGTGTEIYVNDENVYPKNKLK